jgi:hypothetical protein
MPIQPQELVGDDLLSIDSQRQNLDRLKLDLAVELLRTTGQTELSVLGASMLPTIWPHDLVTISKIEYGDVAPGDIIAVIGAEKILIHRVIGKGHGWVTRGDSASQADSPINAAEILGKVIRIKRGSREFVPIKLSTLQQISGWLLCHSKHVRNLVLSRHARRAGSFVLEGHDN